MAGRNSGTRTVRSQENMAKTAKGMTVDQRILDALADIPAETEMDKRIRQAMGRISDDPAERPIDWRDHDRYQQQRLQRGRPGIFRLPDPAAGRPALNNSLSPFATKRHPAA